MIVSSCVGDMSAGSRRARYMCGLIEFLLFPCLYVYFLFIFKIFEYNRSMALGIIYSSIVYNVSMLEIIRARCGIGYVMFMTLMCYTELQLQH